MNSVNFAVLFLSVWYLLKYAPGS